MPCLSAIAFTPLMFEHRDLSGSVLFNNFRDNMGSVEPWAPDLQTLITGCHENLVDEDFVTHTTIEMFDSDNIADGRLILFSPRLEYGVHKLTRL
jgi:hypothetical protein